MGIDVSLEKSIRGNLVIKVVLYLITTGRMCAEYVHLMIYIEFSRLIFNSVFNFRGKFTNAELFWCNLRGFRQQGNQSFFYMDILDICLKHPSNPDVNSCFDVL